MACRKQGPRGSFLRWVIDPEGNLWTDPYLRAPGRGAHLCFTDACFSLAAKRRAFSRSFRRAVQGEKLSELFERALVGLQRKIFEQLSLARRQGATLSGSEQILSSRALISLLIISNDCAEESRRRLGARVAEEALVTYGDRTLLGRSQGKAQRVAVALTEGSIARSLGDDIRRFHHLLVASGGGE